MESASSSYAGHSSSYRTKRHEVQSEPTEVSQSGRTLLMSQSILHEGAVRGKELQISGEGGCVSGRGALRGTAARGVQKRIGADGAVDT